MFSVLCVNEPRKRIFQSRKCDVQLLLSPVKGAAPYKVISVTPGRRGIDWKTVAKAASNSADVMLMPEGFNGYESAGIRHFRPYVLPKVVMINTVANIAKKSGVKYQSVLIDDSDGVVAGFVRRIVPYSAKITVQTATPEKYFEDAVSILEDFGASLRICDSVGAEERFDIAVSDNVVEGAEVQLFPVDVPKKLVAEEIPEEIRRLCPDGINLFDFTCALFECSGLKTAGELTLSQV